MYRGYINQQELKGAIGAKGGVNPIATGGERRGAYLASLEVRDRQQFLKRYKWSNLPDGMDAEILERILYYRGRLVMFKYMDKFYHLPFALNGGIDVYGQYNAVTPLTFNGSVYTDKDGNTSMEDGTFIADMTLTVAKNEFDIEGKECVILGDYSRGISEFIQPRYNLSMVHNQGLADTLVLIRHNLISSAKVYSVRVMNEGEKDAVYEEYDNLESDILDAGKRFFAVTSTTDVKEFLKDKALETQNYWECYVSQDNLRESLMGIENNGIFKKKERVLKGEQELEAGSADMVLQDGLDVRRNVCNIFNKMFGTNIMCDKGEAIDNIEEEELEDEVQQNIPDVPGDTE